MKRILGFLGALIICLFLVSCGKNEVKEIKVINDLKSTYELGEPLDLTNVTLKIIYENDEEEIINVEYDMVDPYDIMDMYGCGKPGIQNLTVNYIDKDGKEWSTEMTVTLVETGFKVAAKKQIDEYKATVEYDAPEQLDIDLRKWAAKSAVNTSLTEADAQAIVESLKKYVDEVQTKAQKDADAAVRAEQDSQIAKIAKLLEDVEKLNTLVGTLAPGTDLTGLQTKVAALETALQKLEGDVAKASTKEELTALQAKLTELETELDAKADGSLADRVTALENLGLDSLEAKLNAKLEEEIKKVNEELAKTNTKFEDFVSKDQLAALVKDSINYDGLMSKLDQLAANQLEVRFNDADKAIEYKLASETTWKKLCNLADLGGIDTLPEIPTQKTPEFKFENNILEWKYEEDPETEWKEIGDFSQYVSSLPAQPAELEFQVVTNGNGDLELQYNLNNEGWQYVCTLADLGGAAQLPSFEQKEIEYRLNNDKLEWSYKGENDWQTTGVDLSKYLNDAVDQEIADLADFVAEQFDASNPGSMAATIEAMKEMIVEVNSQVSEIKKYLNDTLGFDITSNDTLGDYIKDEVVKLADSIINEYLAERFGLESLEELMAFAKEMYGRLIEVKNIAVNMAKAVLAELRSSNPLSTKLYNVFQIVMNFDPLLSALGLKQETIDELHDLIQKLRTKLVGFVKGKICMYVDYIVVPELYSVDQFVAKYGSLLGKYATDLEATMDYEAYQKMLDLVAEVKALVNGLNLSNMGSSFMQLAELVEKITRVDTMHEIICAFLATELEKAYQEIAKKANEVPYKDILLADSLEKMFNAKEIYKNRLLTTKSLETGVELFLEGIGEVNPLIAFINALKDIEEITFAGVRDREDEIKAQIDKAQYYLDKAYDLFDPTELENHLRNQTEVHHIQALDTAIVTDPTLYPTSDFTDLLDAFDDVKSYFDLVLDRVLAPYAITYDLDGGSWAPGNEGPAVFYVRNPQELPEPVKEGYRFETWIDKATGLPITKTPIEMGAIELVAKWTAKQYKLTFVAHDNTVAETRFYDFDEVLGALPTAVASPTGYDLGYWMVDGIALTPTTVWKWTADKEAKAVYNKNVYTITFDSKGGSAVAPIIAEFEADITAAKPAAPTKEGHTFVGWQVVGTTDLVEVPNFMPAGGLDLEAVWSVNQYTMTFDANGGTEVDPITADYGTDLTAYAVTTRTGYTFDGWFDVNDNPYVVSTMPAENMLLTAKWTANTYTIEFVMNEATINEIATAPAFDATYMNGAANAPIVATYTDAATPVASEYVVMPKATFWYIDTVNLFAARVAKWVDANNNVYEIGKEYINLTDIDGATVTLYAVWEEAISNVYLDIYASEYVVFEGLRYGDIIAFYPDKVDINGDGIFDDVDKTHIIPENQSLPQGTTFLGWVLLDGEGGNRIDSTKILIADQTAYSIWTGIEDGYGEAILDGFNYTVTFDKNNDLATGVMPQVMFKYKENTILPLNTYALDTYKFAGWATEANGPVVWADGAECTYVPTKGNDELTLYAVWEDNAYDIEFDTTDCLGTQPGQTHVISEDLTLNPSVLTKTGYTFAGWTTADKSKFFADGATITSSEALAEAGQTVTLYPVWSANTYKVVFKPNYPLGGGVGSMVAIHLEYDAAPLALPLNAYETNDKQYAFGGWATSATGAVEYVDGADVQNLAANAGETVYLYAQWVPAEHTIKVQISPEKTIALKIFHGETYEAALMRHFNVTDTADLYTTANVGWYGHKISSWDVMYAGTKVESDIDVAVAKFNANAYPMISEITLVVNWNLGSWTILLTNTLTGKTYTATVTYMQNFNKLPVLFDKNGEYEFAGWYIEIGGQLVKLDDSKPWIYEDEPVVSQWTKK